MVGASSGAPASGSAPESAPSFRKAPADANRIPGSAASMKVQERRKADSAPTASTSASTSSTPASASNQRIRSKAAIQAMQPFLDSSTNAASPIQPTDVQLLTTSILSNQERQRVILHYQEQLIDTQPSLIDLKKALLFLSSSSWGQILEERKLAGKCAYPPCSNASPSISGTGAGRGRFRINLRKQSVTAVEDLDLGEAGNTYDDLRDYFCRKACYARSEWILRWVLSDSEIGLPNAETKGARGVLGGKWQKLTSQPSGGSGGYEQIELLEDIERESGVDFDDEEGDKSGLLLVGDSGAAASTEPVVTRSINDGKKDATAGVSNLLGDLTIIERTKTKGDVSTPASSSTTTTAAAKETIKPILPSRTPYTVDVPNTLGQRFHPSLSSTARPPQAAAEEEDGRDADLEDEIESRERELSHILRYASLATGSRRRPPTRKPTAIQISSTLAAAAAAGDSANPPIDTNRHGDDSADADCDDDAPPLDPHLAAERAELRRVMNLALDVRREQREQGLLD